MYKDKKETGDSYYISAAETPGDNEGKFATLLLSDNALVRAGLTHFLSGTRFMVVDTSEVIPAFCLVDASRPPELVLEAVTSIKSQHPACKVALIEGFGDIGFVQAAISAGVDGFCAVTSVREVMVKSFELIMLGEKLLPSALVQTLFSQSSETRSPVNAVVGNNSLDPRAQKLSPREKVILQSIMGGDANKVIARKLDVAEATVKVHVKAILRKVGAANRTQAAMWAAGHLTNADSLSAAGMKEEPRLN